MCFGGANTLHCWCIFVIIKCWICYQLSRFAIVRREVAVSKNLITVHFNHLHDFTPFVCIENLNQSKNSILNPMNEMKFYQFTKCTNSSLCAASRRADLVVEMIPLTVARTKLNKSLFIKDFHSIHSLHLLPTHRTKVQINQCCIGSFIRWRPNWRNLDFNFIFC